MLDIQPVEPITLLLSTNELVSRKSIASNADSIKQKSRSKDKTRSQVTQ